MLEHMNQMMKDAHDKRATKMILYKLGDQVILDG